MSEAFDPEQMLETKESFESVSTENSEEDGGSGNRAYVPCGVGATVQVGCLKASLNPVSLISLRK
jgi:hypothetical protein